MNAPRLSFLFFLTTLSIVGFKGYSQQKDSVRYYYNKMLYPTKSSDIPLAIQYYTAQSEKYLAAHNDYEAIKALRMIAIGQNEIGNTYDSESAAVQAISLIENSPHTDTLIESRVGIYNQLGKIYRASDQFEKAIGAYNLALQFSRRTADSMTLINNKGTIYKDSKKYQKALQQFNLAFQKKNSNLYPQQLARVLDNMGYVQSKLNNPNALPNLNRALQIRDSLHDVMGIFSSNKHLALYYMERGDKQLAQSFSTKAYEAANKINSLSYLEEALSLFAIMTNDPKIAQLNTITDSIAKEKQLAQNKNAYLKYNVEKERKNTMAAQLLQEKEKGQKLLYMSLGIFATVLAVCIIMILRARHKKEKVRQVYNTEARISKKVHDEVANDLYQVMVKLQQSDQNKETLLDDIESIYNKTRDISKENSAVEVSENFTEQLTDLLLSYKSDRTAVITQNISKMNWKAVSNLKKITIYRVLKELMTNMSKHSQAPLVAISFSQNNNKINITYSDNGVGCKIKNKNGLQNAENRIQTLRGTINFESKPNEGFKAKITL